MPQSSGRARRTAFTVVCILAGGAGPLAAQYPLAPTPVMPLAGLSPRPMLTGYATARATYRDDTLTFTITRARLTLQVLPIPFAALRVQVDFSGIGRARGDTIPATLLTDAFVELAPQDTSVRAVALLRPVVLIGQFRTPFSMEYLTSSTQVPTVNRSQVVDRLASRRDLGALARVSVSRFATLTGALVNGEGPNRTINTNGKLMAIGRLTVLPHRSLAVSGKWLGHGADHRWGSDARWITGKLIVEGEVIAQRATGDSVGTFDGNGAYALAAYTVRPWLQSVVKWERLRETSSAPLTRTERRLTWVTYGANLMAPEGGLRFQLAWISKSEPGSDGELVGQLQLVF